MAWHAGRCAVCGSGPSLVLDHDHGTGYVRGLLCVACNGAEGRSSASVYAQYRHIHPAYLLDIWVKWSDNPKWRYRHYRYAG